MQTDSPPAIVARDTRATTTEKVTLAALSVIDIVQTETLLHESSPTGVWAVRPHENDPLLGSHPTLARMAVTGVAFDEVILHIRSPFVRRLSIGIEAGNVVRNVFVLTEKL